MLYKSVIGYGKAYFLEDAAEKTVRLNILTQHYTKTAII